VVALWPQKSLQANNLLGNLQYFVISEIGTKPIKNKDSKKNVLVFDQSTKDINLNSSLNFGIMATLSEHTISPTKNL
jgi:hypothetical protein